ncbi:imelysin family protein [Aliiroseovarius sp. YM-037]|uniref:imelysin family protein n=1 Tax=Aliiroseovarius sp. YM-037 TaxID=3341728 RepID=UPI003A80A9FB
MRVLAAALIALASPAVAGVDAVIDDHILPGYARFATEAATLSDAAEQDCTAEALRSAFQSTFDAWMGISHIRLGPAEEGGRVLAIAFWPDTRGLTDKTLRRLIADQDPVVGSAETYADVSIAAQGMFALERLLYDETLSSYAAGSYTCTLTAAIAGNLAELAGDIQSEWQDGFAETLRAAGDAGNTRFLTEREAAQALFTALTTALEFDADQRLGRPLGSFDRPRSKRAEAWRSGRPLRNITLSLEALRDLAATLTDEKPTATLAAFDAALEAANALDDPIFAGVEDPQGRLEVEILQQRIQAIRQAVISEIGPALGVAAGFNSADGD